MYCKYINFENAKNILGKIVKEKFMGNFFFFKFGKFSNCMQTSGLLVLMIYSNRITLYIQVLKVYINPVSKIHSNCLQKRKCLYHCSVYGITVLWHLVIREQFSLNHDVGVLK